MVFCLVGRVRLLVKSCQDLQRVSKCCRGLIGERGLTDAQSLAGAHMLTDMQQPTGAQELADAHMMTEPNLQ